MTNREYNFKKLCVLVADDNHHMRKLLSDLLEVIGVGRIALAQDGADAFDRYLEVAPDIVITDGAMAPMDGYELTRKIRMEPDSPNPFVPVLMLSGHLEKARVEMARDSGVTEYLAKPVSTDSLRIRIVSVIENPRPFVRTAAYFGPDRRRRVKDLQTGPSRRADDAGLSVQTPTGKGGDDLLAQCLGNPVKGAETPQGVEFVDNPTRLLAKVAPLTKTP